MTAVHTKCIVAAAATTISCSFTGAPVQRVAAGEAWEAVSLAATQEEEAGHYPNGADWMVG